MIYVRKRKKIEITLGIVFVTKVCLIGRYILLPCSVIVVCCKTTVSRSAHNKIFFKVTSLHLVCFEKSTNKKKMWRTMKIRMIMIWKDIKTALYLSIHLWIRIYYEGKDISNSDGDNSFNMDELIMKITFIRNLSLIWSACIRSMYLMDTEYVLQFLFENKFLVLNIWTKACKWLGLRRLSAWNNIPIKKIQVSIYHFLIY